MERGVRIYPPVSFEVVHDGKSSRIAKEFEGKPGQLISFFSSWWFLDQMKLGVSMKVEKKSLSDIDKKLESLKRKKEDGEKYGLI